jgi:predicted PurR-regulated permease PerM
MSPRSHPAPDAVEPVRAPAERGSALSWVLAVALVAGVAYLYRSVALPLVAATLVAYLLNPVVAWFERRGIRRGVAAAALFLAAAAVFAVVISGMAQTVREQAAGAIAELPEFSKRVEQTTAKTLASIRTAQPMLARFLPPTPAPGWTGRLIEQQQERLGEIAGQVGQVVSYLILVPIFAFFLLRDGGKILAYAVRQMSPRHIETTVAIWCEIDRILGRYLRGVMIESAVVGALAAIGLWILGVPVPMLLGVIAALLNPIPYIGALVSLSLAAVVAVGSEMGAGSLLAIVVLFAAIRLLDDLVVVPLTVGGSVHLHPALVIASIVAGEHLFGVLGMVFAVLTVTIVKEIARLLLEQRRKRLRPEQLVGLRFVSGNPFVC